MRKCISLIGKKMFVIIKKLQFRILKKNYKIKIKDKKRINRNILKILMINKIRYKSFILNLKIIKNQMNKI